MKNKKQQTVKKNLSATDALQLLNKDLLSSHKRMVLRDIAILAVCSIAVFTVTGYFEAFERMAAFFHSHQPSQIDEIPIVLSVLCILMVVFSIRKWNVLKQELGIRSVIESKLVQSLQEKEILLREVHHRVKNNFQIISSLLNLQKQNYREPELLQLFNVCENRIRAMALIHEKLYNSDNLSLIDFGEFIRAMAMTISSSGFSRHDVTMSIQAEDLLIEINQAIPCGLIINELITNSLKHAFPVPRDNDRIIIELKRKDDEVELGISDNGSGLPDDFDPGKTDTLGLKLVFGLVQQIHGTIDIKNSGGTGFDIKFRITSQKKDNSRL